MRLDLFKFRRGCWLQLSSLWTPTRRRWAAVVLFCGLVIVVLVKAALHITEARCQSRFGDVEPRHAPQTVPLIGEEASLKSLAWEAAVIPTSFLIEQKDFCARRPGLRVITYVHSAIDRRAKRQAVRDTWGTSDPSHVGVVFMVGVAKTPGEEAIVRQESALYGDIVQGNYTDLYERLTYKALNALHWVAKNCARVPWLMHADDDIIVDVRLLLSTTARLEAEERRNNEFFCYLFYESEPIRELDHRWGVSSGQYPCRFYPPYCNGPAWFVSARMVGDLLEAARATRYFYIDDVYLTGFVRLKAGVGISPVEMRGEFDPAETGSVVVWWDAEVATDDNETRTWRNLRQFYNDV